MSRLRARLLSVITALLVVMNLVSCGGSKTDGHGDSARELGIEYPSVVKLWYQDERYTSYFEYVATEFNKVNPLVTIQPTLISEESFAEYIYNESVHKDNAPDVFVMSTDNLEKVSMMGLIAENSTYSKNYTVENFGHAAIEAATFKGKLYGYPLSFNVPYLVYNATVAEHVDTFNDLTMFCDSYQVDETNEMITQLMLWDASDMLCNFGFASGSLNIGGETADESSIVEVDRSRLLSSMEHLLELRDYFGMDRNAADLDKCATDFASGTMAYTILDMNRYNQIKDSDVNYKICPIPSMKNDYAVKNISENTCVFVNPYAKNIKVSKAVANAISFEYADCLYEYSGLLPSRCIASEDVNYADRDGVIYSIFDSAGVKAQFMGSAYFYAKYEILIDKLWAGEDVTTTVENFVNDITADDHPDSVEDETEAATEEMTGTVRQ